MSFQSKLTIIVGAGLLAAVSGCSVYENVKSKITGKPAENTTKVVSGADAVEVKNSEKVHEAAQNVAQGTTANTDRQMRPVVVNQGAINATVMHDNTDTIATTTPKTSTLSELEQIVGGSWTIVKVGSTVIDRDEDMPYIVFVPGEGRFYANNGCNTLNGGYAIKDNVITFHNVLTTMRLCPDVDFDHEINTIIADNADSRLAVSEEGNETLLDFVTPTGKVLMRLRRGNLDFLNGQWDIVAVGSLSELKVPATIFFDLNDMKLHGNTGCNFINGEIYLDHRRPNAVDFSNIITTLRACQWPQQQTAILVALEEAEAVVSDGADSVQLLGASDKVLLTLSRAKQ